MAAWTGACDRFRNDEMTAGEEQIPKETPDPVGDENWDVCGFAAPLSLAMNGMLADGWTMADVPITSMTSQAADIC